MISPSPIALTRDPETRNRFACASTDDAHALAVWLCDTHGFRTHELKLAECYRLRSAGMLCVIRVPARAGTHRVQCLGSPAASDQLAAIINQLVRPPTFGEVQ